MRKFVMALAVSTISIGIANLAIAGSDLRVDFEATGGFGATFGGKLGDGTFNLNVGVTPLTVDKNRAIGVLGVGYVLDFYDFDFSGSAKNLARQTSGTNSLGGFLTTGFVSIIPLRVGPFTYQFSLSRHVMSYGLDSGRVHLVTFDVINFIRLARY